MWTRREAIATTSFEAVRAMENGLAGSGMVVGSFAGSERWWKWRVLSQEEDMRRARIGRSTCFQHWERLVRSYRALYCRLPDLQERYGH